MAEAGSFSLRPDSSHSLALSTLLPLSASLPPLRLSALVGLLTLVVYFLPHKRPPNGSSSAKDVSWDVYSLPLGLGQSPSPRATRCGRHLVARRRCGAVACLGAGAGREPLPASGAAPGTALVSCVIPGPVLWPVASVVVK